MWTPASRGLGTAMSPGCTKAVLIALMLCLLPGCAFLLPKGQTTTRSKWNSYEEASTAFDLIVPNETRTQQLVALGFHPTSNPNVKVLTYLDLMQRFMPNPSITLGDLDDAVRGCIEAREKSEAWELDLNNIKSRRYGNALLDITGFVRKTQETGWRFTGILLIRDGRVVYKLASGQPRLDRQEKKIRPLGPLQELDSIVSRGVTAFK